MAPNTADPAPGSPKPPASAAVVPDPIYADPRLAACYDTFDGSREDLDHYEAILDELGARTVIDVGCGTGSLAVRLAARGLAVTGVDPAAASLDIARGKPGAEQVTWRHGTAEDLPPAGPDGGADAAVMTGNVAQVFLEDAAWAATLRGVRGALRPGGWFVVESRRPEVRAWEDWTTAEPPRTVEVPGVGPVTVRPTVFALDLPRVTFGDEFLLPDGTCLESVSTLRFRGEDELRDSLAAARLPVQEIRDAPDRPGREYVILARAV